MSEGFKHFSPKLSRQQAHECAKNGTALLARAFNHFGADDVPYRYSDAVQARFFALGVEMARLIEHGEIEANPSHGLYRRALAAKSDEALQAVIRRATKRTRIQGAKQKRIFRGQST